MSAPAPAPTLELDDIVVNDFPFRFPRYLRPIVGVDSRLGGMYFEAPAMRGLLATVSPGDIVYDIGMSWGVFTCILSRLVGPEGRVHSFEANPEVLRGAREFIAANGFAGQVTLTLACAGELSGHPVRFFVVPAASSVASTRNRDIQAFHSDAWPLQIPSIALDYYVASAGAGKPPACLKIDVEGSEYLVLRGAERMLAEHHPYLVLETHGKEVDGIGGSVAEVCDLLAALEYDLYDLEECAPVEAAAFAAAHVEKIGYLLAAPPAARATLEPKLAALKAVIRDPYPLPQDQLG